jgi:hypothetical protein
MQEIKKESYFDLPQISNSDLSWLKSILQPPKVIFDTDIVFAFGNLLDAIITEPNRIDFHKRMLDGVRYKKTDFTKAEKMCNSYLSDEYCRSLLKKATFQDIIIKENFEINFNGCIFTVDARCKWDLLIRNISLGADIKSTDAKTQIEFESAINYFDYDRQAAWYMDITNIDIMIIIGISKKNCKVFKVFISRDSELYKSGYDKYSYLAFKYKLLFG